jgi:UTP--glucose-1-phosphate uridylyltransferase
MIEDAVIVAAGKGTRMLPASLFSAKETLPLVDTPILNHLVWEAAKSGVKRIYLILSNHKFRQLSCIFEGRGLDFGRFRPDLPDEALSFGAPGVDVVPRIQNNPNGIMDAISVALEEISGAFLVLLGDMLLMDAHFGPKSSGPRFASNASKKLVSSYMETGLPCVGVNPVKQDKVVNYGVVEVADGMVVDIKEKPNSEYTKSNLILSGRYIFPEDTKDLLKRFSYEKFGELQSIEILKYLAQNVGLNAVNLDGMEIYDSGDPIVWLKSQIDHALRREDISYEIRKFIKSVL